ncbi:MAG TPA: RdgB/HAM1 family non-canonical purine NTP pyrophosphatase [Candidatus Acidoferrum sp.]|nr:RdgB/HAM1 family non-canonical purine NTP pyrophosphatase [Candidatus Acidoferrum sp.]
MRAPVKLFLASSNPGKLQEYRTLAEASAPTSLRVDLALVPAFASLPAFEEKAPTFAENAAGKALHYSRIAEGLIFADDSGLVVPALGGAPGVVSARYAGADATNSQRIARLLQEMREVTGEKRAAHFICAIALARQAGPLAVVTARVDGEILPETRGTGGFGYDPVFFFPPLEKTFAELSAEEKNLHSHRGKAFRKLFVALSSML